MAPKAAQERAKKKAAKQKKLLMLLALPMLGALVYAYTTMSSLGGKTQVAAPPTAATAPAGSTRDGRHAGRDRYARHRRACRSRPCARSPRSARKDPFHDHGPNPGAEAKPSSSTSSKTPSKSKGKGSGSGSTPKPPSVAADRRRHLDQRQEACPGGGSGVRAGARLERRLSLPPRQGEPEDRAHRRGRDAAAVHAPRQEAPEAPAGRRMELHAHPRAARIRRSDDCCPADLDDRGSIAHGFLRLQRDQRARPRGRRRHRRQRPRGGARAAPAPRPARRQDLRAQYRRLVHARSGSRSGGV